MNDSLSLTVAQENAVDPRELFRASIDDIRVGLSALDHQGSDEVCLAKQADVHLENAAHCLEMLTRPATEHCFASCEGCEECDEPLVLTLNPFMGPDADDLVLSLSGLDGPESREKSTEKEPPEATAIAPGVEQAPTRKPYSPPSIRFLGSVRDLTNLGQTSGKPPTVPGVPRP